MLRSIRVALLAALTLASPALAAVVETATGPVEMPDAAPVAEVADAAPMAMAMAFAAPAEEPIRVAVYGLGYVEGILNAAGGIAATRIGSLSPETLAGYDCVIARVYYYQPAAEFQALRDFVAAGGCYIGEWWGAGWALSEVGPSYNYPYYQVTDFGQLFTGAASDGSSIQTGLPITIVQDHPAVAGLSSPFSAGGATEYFVRAIPPYDPRLTVVATYQGYGGTYPAIMVGSTGASRAVLLFFDAGDDSGQPAMQILWPSVVRWAAVHDDVPPVTAAAFSGTPGHAPWWLSDVVVTLAATDDRSGVASTEFTLDGLTWSAYEAPFTVSAEGQTTLCYRSTDAAGNVEAAQCTDLFIDKTAPAVLIASPADGAELLLRQLVTADWSASDAVSGLELAQGTAAPGEPVDTASVGQKSFSVYARDVAGNEITVTATYFVRYGFGGFLPPVLADGSGVYRLGSTIPVKFRLYDAFGAIVGDAAATLSLLQVSGEVTGTVPVDAAASGEANDGTSFRYDAAGQLYIYNLSTKQTALATGTWQLRAALDDGSVRTAIVSLR